jgi:putative transposase
MRLGPRGRHCRCREGLTMLSLIETDNDRTVEVRLGDVVRITLPENASTGFRWTIDRYDEDIDPPPTKWSDLRYVSTSRRTAMARKRYKPEEVVAKLRQVDVLVSQGQDMADAIRQIGVSEVTYYRWRQEFGGLKIEQVKRLKDLELENSRLRKAVSDLTLDKLILQEAARGNF